MSDRTERFDVLGTLEFHASLHASRGNMGLSQDTQDVKTAFSMTLDALLAWKQWQSAPTDDRALYRKAVCMTDEALDTFMVTT